VLHFGFEAPVVNVRIDASDPETIAQVDRMYAYRIASGQPRDYLIDAHVQGV
jgi:hypothetical protein